MTNFTPEEFADEEWSIAPIEGSLFDWEKSLKGSRNHKELIATANIAGEMNDPNLGFRILSDFTKGFEEQDLERLDWSIARFIYLIHKGAARNAHYTDEAGNVYLPEHFDNLSSITSTAGQKILEKLQEGQVSDQNLNFGSGTISQRFSIQKIGNEIIFKLNCAADSSEDNYLTNNLDYYRSIAGLFGLHYEDIDQGKKEGHLEKDTKLGKIEIGFKDNKYSTFRIKLPTENQ